MDVTWSPDLVDPRVAKAVQLAHDDIGRVRERPMGSNRSPIIDAYNRASGSPPGSFWCANALAAWWRGAGLDLPPRDVGSCDAWKDWALRTGRWSPLPVVGAAVVYGRSMRDANHIGLVYDFDNPATVFSIEGNTSLDGYSRNGELVTLKLVRRDHLLGYVHPFPT